MSSKELTDTNYCNRAISLKNALERDFMLLAEHLYKIKEYELWRANWGSWIEYTWELKMSATTIKQLIQVYKTFVVDYGITKEQLGTAGGLSHVADTLPVIKNKKDALRWLVKAQTLTRADLRKELTEAKTGIPMASCKHSETYTVEICKHCGERVRKL